MESELPIKEPVQKRSEQLRLGIERDYDEQVAVSELINILSVIQCAMQKVDEEDMDAGFSIVIQTGRPK